MGDNLEPNRANLLTNRLNTAQWLRLTREKELLEEKLAIEKQNHEKEVAYLEEKNQREQ